MSEINYQYDIAFSFLKVDEGTAMQLNDLLQDRFKTFIYPNRQEQLAGSDGEENSPRCLVNKRGRSPCCTDLVEEKRLGHESKRLR